MSKSFASMSSEEQNKLIKDVGDLLVKHNIAADVKTVHEVVCNIKGTDIEHNVDLVVKKEMPQSQQAAVDAFNAEVKALTEGISGVTCQLACTCGAGMKYQTIKDITSIHSDEKINLEHDGRAMMIDFWATWCPPCQAPMAHNQTMLEKRGEDWKGNLRVIGLSIDQGREAVVKHVEDKKWTSVEHFHRAGSNCSQVYGVRGVPHIMLVDKEGTILFKGHPATRKNLEDDLDKLARGEKLEGEGIVELMEEKAGDAPAEIKVEEGFKEMDTAEVMREVTTFKEACSGFQKDENLKTAAKDMPRSFCVIVLQNSFNPQTGKTFSKYENYRVLVGKQESIDSLKSAFESNLKGSWEVNEQIRAL